MATAETPQRKPLILVCDDDIMVRMLARECLEAEGMCVIEAEDGAQAVEVFIENSPELVFLDVDMPRKSGIEVCEEIRALAEGTTVPIMIATGAEDKATIDAGFNAGATQYKTKPVNWSLLGRDIRYMLRAARALNDLKAQEDRLRYLAYFDHLTGLPNRRSFLEQLQREINDENGTRSVGLVMINIDQFKRINDSIGHERGDDLLYKFAARLSEFVSAANGVGAANDVVRDESAITLARHGGDEFALVINNPASVETIVGMSKEILSALAKPVAIQGHTLVVTPSIGIATYPAHANSPEQLLRRADVAMRNAKSGGGGDVRVFNHSLEGDYERQLVLEQGLREALAGEGLAMVYQPQVDVKTGRVAGAEALVRWTTKEGESISPATFIPVAERSGLISPLGDWILRRVHLDAKQAAGKFPANIAISINLSPLQFSQSNFVEHVADTLRQLELGHDIELELTEGVIMSDAEGNLSKLRQLKTLGFKLAIDDFGTGYSSLSYLRHFPIDTLKIDRSFIQDIGSPDGDGIVRAILALCKELKLKAIAEGVETPEQAAFLCSNGCDLLQGYLLCRPTTVEGLIAATERDYTAYLSSATANES